MFRYHLHINAARELAVVHLMWKQQLSLEILYDHVLSYSPVVLIFSYEMVWKVAFVGKTLLRTSALVNQGRVHPRRFLDCYN